MTKRIRRIQSGDVNAVLAIYAPFITDSATSFEMEVPTLAEMANRVRGIEDQYPWLVYEEDEKVLGYAYASVHRLRKAYQWSTEVSVYLHESARRRGVGRSLYLVLFDLLRWQGYASAYAGITLPNPASVGLHESLGFKPIGIFSRCGYKLGAWHDVAWLQLSLQEMETPLSAPVSINDLLADGNRQQSFEKNCSLFAGKIL